MTFRGGFLAIGLFVIVVGCSSDSIRTRVALRQAGANRTELERVLAHYSKNPADSLKLKAAKYLIGNMPLHRSYSGAIENYYDAVDSLIPLVEDKTIFKDRMACLYKEYEPSITLSSDLRTINSDFLISSIDNAFDLWENGKWACHLDFEEFEELLLPYNCVDLSDLLNLYEIGDKSGKYEVLIIFSPPNEDLSGLIEELKLRDYEHPMIVDSNKEFEIGNPSMPTDKRFHTFLIDEKGLPLFVGNPNGSEELYGLFMKAVGKLK